jgi:hypothetical protein
MRHRSCGCPVTRIRQWKSRRCFWRAGRIQTFATFRDRRPLISPVSEGWIASLQCYDPGNPTIHEAAARSRGYLERVRDDRLEHQFVRRLGQPETDSRLEIEQRTREIRYAEQIVLLTRA